MELPAAISIARRVCPLLFFQKEEGNGACYRGLSPFISSFGNFRGTPSAMDMNTTSRAILTWVLSDPHCQI